jgi:hypothetical protein
LFSVLSSLTDRKTETYFLGILGALIILQKPEKSIRQERELDGGEVRREEEMDRTLNLLAASALLWSCSMVVTPPVYSQEAQAGATANAQANAGEKGQTAQSSLAAGTAVNAELDKSLDSKKAKVGDAVAARTTEAVKEDGKVVLPKGTKLTGRVVRASARSKGDSDSTLGVQFDRAELKGGQEMAVQLTLQALAAPAGVTPIGGDDLQGMGNAGGSASTSGSSRAGVGAPVGGAVSGAGSTVARTTGSVAGAADSTVNSTTNAASGVAGAAGATTQGAVGGLNSSGQLTSNSRGVFGLNGLSLSADQSNSTQGSLIASSGKSVRLDSGTRLLLTTQANTSASAQR